MKNFPIEHDGRVDWISRSVAVVGFIFCIDNDKLLVLANKRGKGCPNYQGYWNCPCGYIDYDETIKEACCREIYEETNLKVGLDDLILYRIEDNPKADDNQNIVFNYYTFSDRLYKGQTVYAKGAEPNEVEEVEWIPIEEVDNYQFAFNHNKMIKRIAHDILYFYNLRNSNKN